MNEPNDLAGSQILRDCRILAWDSELLGVPVARIEPQTLDPAALEQRLQALRRADVALAYWLTPGADTQVDAAVARCGGLLVDQRVTYVRALDANPRRESASATARGDRTSRSASDCKIVRYDDDVAADELRRLAIGTGLRSRFAVDPRIPTDKYEELYVAWIENCVARRAADEVFVARTGDNRIVGYVTMSKKRTPTGSRGDLGLIAVDEAVRGQRVGRRLVEAMLDWTRGEAIAEAQVVTQGRNIAACRLYESCAFAVESTERWFHIWL